MPAATASPGSDPAAARAWIQGCIAELSSKADLRRYTTTDAVASHVVLLPGFSEGREGFVPQIVRGERVPLRRWMAR